MATPTPNWFLAAMHRGLARLLTLSLDRTPAADLLGETAQTWADALWPSREWYAEADVPRITEGFRRLTGIARQWPAPADFLQALPPREASTSKQLPSRVFTEEERAENLARLTAMLREAGIIDGARP